MSNFEISIWELVALALAVVFIWVLGRMYSQALFKVVRLEEKCLELMKDRDEAWEAWAISTRHMIECCDLLAKLESKRPARGPGGRFVKK